MGSSNIGCPHESSRKTLRIATKVTSSRSLKSFFDVRDASSSGSRPLCERLRLLPIPLTRQRVAPSCHCRKSLPQRAAATEVMAACHGHCASQAESAPSRARPKAGGCRPNQVVLRSKVISTLRVVGLSGDTGSWVDIDHNERREAAPSRVLVLTDLNTPRHYSARARLGGAVPRCLALNPGVPI